MSLLLAKGEQVVKVFQYGEKKQKGLFASKKDNIKRSLIVTNKRIISQAEGQNATARKEIPLSAADYVTSGFSKRQMSFVPAIIFGVLSLIFLIVSLVINPEDEFYGVNPALIILKYAMLALCGLFFILALIFLIMFFTNRSASVEVIIAGKCLETELLSVASSNMAAGRAKIFKIIVNKDVAYPMINELGAILLDLKSGKYEKAE